MGDFWRFIVVIWYSGMKMEHGNLKVMKIILKP
jgi:hypothetical protein